MNTVQENIKALEIENNVKETLIKMYPNESTIEIQDRYNNLLNNMISFGQWCYEQEDLMRELIKDMLEVGCSKRSVVLLISLRMNRGVEKFNLKDFGCEVSMKLSGNETGVFITVEFPLFGINETQLVDFNISIS